MGYKIKWVLLCPGHSPSKEIEVDVVPIPCIRCGNLPNHINFGYNRIPSVVHCGGLDCYNMTQGVGNAAEIELSNLSIKQWNRENTILTEAELEFLKEFSLNEGNRYYTEGDEPSLITSNKDLWDSLIKKDIIGKSYHHPEDHEYYEILEKKHRTKIPDWC